MLISIFFSVAFVGCASSAPKGDEQASNVSVPEKRVVEPRNEKDSAHVTVSPLGTNWNPWSSRGRPEDLPEFGKKGDQTIQVKISGEVTNQGIYNLGIGSSLLDAITAAGGFGPFAVSRFWLVRGQKVFSISIGRSGSHYFSPDTADYLPLWSLLDGDNLHVQMVMPY